MAKYLGGRVIQERCYDFTLTSRDLRRLNALLLFATDYTADYPDSLRGMEFSDLAEAFKSLYLWED